LVEKYYNRQTYKMIQADSKIDPSLNEKQRMISEQTRQLNEFYNPETMYRELNSDGSLKPLDSLAKQENERLGIF